MTRLSFSFIIILATVLFAAGCVPTTTHEGLPTLAPCSIAITQGGLPLESAVVTLVLSEGGTKWVVGGRTNASGVAEIWTQMKYPGAPLGNYKVRIAKTVTEYGAPVPSKDIGEAPITPSTTFTLVPLEFDNVKQTPHEISVVAGKNTATFDVGVPVRQEIQ